MVKTKVKQYKKNGVIKNNFPKISLSFTYIKVLVRKLAGQP